MKQVVRVTKRSIDLLRLKPPAALDILSNADPGVRRVRLWYCGLKEFSFLSRFPALERLEIAGWPPPTLNDLRRVPRLRWLELLHLPKAEDLGPLTALKDLEHLELRTLPSWDASGRMNTFASLAPLAALPKLNHLMIYKARIRRDGLRPLAAIRSLEKLDFGNTITVAEAAWLAGKRPDIKSAILKPYWRPRPPIPCGQCGTPRVTLTGTRGPRRPLWICPTCRKGYFDEALAEFEAIRAAAAAAD